MFDYRSEDFEEGVRAATQGQGVDVIIDFVGGDYLARNLRSLAPGGRLVQVGLLGGKDTAELPLSVLLHNHLRIIGTVMKSRDAEEKRAMVRRFAENALPMFTDGRLKPLVGEVFPLSEAANAHRCMETGGGFGKIVIEGLTLSRLHRSVRRRATRSGRRADRSSPAFRGERLRLARGRASSFPSRGRGDLAPCGCPRCDPILKR